MASDIDPQRVLQNPSFRQLIYERSNFSWILSAVMLGIYFGFIILVAFGKDLLAIKIGSGVTSLGILVGLAVIFAAFILTGIYVYRANTRFDQLTANLKRELTQ